MATAQMHPTPRGLRVVLQIAGVEVYLTVRDAAQVRDALDDALRSLDLPPREYLGEEAG